MSLSRRITFEGSTGVAQNGSGKPMSALSDMSSYVEFTEIDELRSPERNLTKATQLGSRLGESSGQQMIIKCVILIKV